MWKNKVHFINTVFTGRGIEQFGGNEWYKKRIEIFKKYCLKSLLNQSNRNFIHWICFRPEEKENPQTKALAKYLDKLKYNYIFTFYGQSFWDDKTSNIGLEEKMQKSIDDVAKYIKGKEYVYFTVLDSDDMFHGDMVKTIQEEEYGYAKALTPIKGYILNDDTGQLADWNHPSCPPYYTIMFPVNIFLSAKKQLEYYYPFVSHEDIIRIFKCKRMPDNLYCCTVHSGNISTHWEHKVRGKEYFYESEKREILKGFGIIK